MSDNEEMLGDFFSEESETDQYVKSFAKLFRRDWAPLNRAAANFWDPKSPLRIFIQGLKWQPAHVDPVPPK